MSRPIGATLDALGVQADLNEGDLVASAVVVMTVLVRGETRPQLSIANSADLDWVQQVGLLHLAAKICAEP